MTEQTEEWKIIEDYPDYFISNMGRVKSCKFKKEKILKPGNNTRGYFCVNLCNQEGQKNIKIHRLVAKAFLENPDNKPEVDHIDRNRQNNCVCNLRWATHSENNQNRSLQETNTGEHHISYIKRHNRFQVKKVINKNRIDKHYHTLEEAIEFRDSIIPE